MADLRRELNQIIVNAGLEDMRAIYNELDSEGRAILLRALDEQMTDTKKRQALSEVRQVVQKADEKTQDWLIRGIGVAYLAGMATTDDTLRSYGVKIGKQKYTLEVLRTVEDMKPHLQAVNLLMNDAYADFGNAMRGYVRGSERILNEALREKIRLRIAQGRLKGEDVRTIKRDIKATLGRQGFTVLIDRGGRQWSLDQYSEMLTRTHLIKANAQATANRLMERGRDLVEISSHGATDALCAPHEGKVYSLSGNSTKYKKIPQFPFHPNCKHSLIPRPDLEPDEPKNR